MKDVEVVYSGDNYTVEVKYKGETVFTWNDEANVDYPEDLRWARKIGEVFWDGVSLGKKLAEDEK